MRSYENVQTHQTGPRPVFVMQIIGAARPSLKLVRRVKGRAISDYY